MCIKNLVLFMVMFFLSGQVLSKQIYSHDSSGSPLSGSKSELIEAALSGKQLAVKINVNGLAVYRGSLVQLHGDTLCMMTTLFAVNIKSPGSFTAVRDPYSANFCTNGIEYVRHGNRAYYPNRMTMTWIVVD